MHQSWKSSAQPSSYVFLDILQEQGLAAYLPSYFSSQCEMCSIGIDLSSIEIAFSTGMTCMPIPAPPGGTSLVTCSSGRKAILSKNRPSSGFSSRSFSFMLLNSPIPGTNIGRTYLFFPSGFFPSRFSQLYSRSPLMLMLSRSS